jgi:FkbM family methyltransferase
VTVLDILQRALEHLPVRGKGRLAEQILRHAKTETLKCSPLHGLEIHLRRSQRIERLMWAGAYERRLVALLKKIVKPSMTVLDVGANIGYIAAIAARLAGQEGHVHAFDPNPDCYARLKLNLSAFPQGHAHPLAISDYVGTLPLYLSEIPGEQGWGSLLEDAATVRQTLDVTVATLDDFVAKVGIQRVHLIKIDIEGNEMHALRGARKLIGRDHPAIIAELNATCLARDGAKPSDVIEFLTISGYSIRFLDSDNIYAEY